MKSKFFSKLKDYNYIMDQLLEKKNFEEDVKNLLLSMVYKIETSYNDYSKIKRNNLSQNEFIDNIIIKTLKEHCGYIYLVDPKNGEKDILEKQNVIAMTNEVEKKIYAYPTEIALLYGISDIKPKFFFIGNKYNYIKQPFQEMLIEGTNLNNTEVIRNFNGWSWNVEVDSRINNIYNCLYQTLSLLFGHTFLDFWENDFSGKKDYISEMRKRMEEGYSKNISDSFYIAFCNVLILNARKSEQMKQKRTLQLLLKEYKEMKDKNKYIYTISKEKKVLETQIKNIEDTLENKDLLLKEYNVRNLKLSKNKKIFNVSELTEILEKEKKEKEKLMTRLTELTKPSVYNKNKHDINVIPEDKPSSPSIRFIAFVIPTIHPTVNIKLIISGICTPLITSILIPATYIIIADITCTLNFIYGFRFFKSSKYANIPIIIIPIKKPSSFIL